MTTVAVFGASSASPGDAQYEQAVRLGRLLARAGMVVANGGYGGTMEAVSAGARQEGGEVVGVLAPSVFPGRSGPNGHLTSSVSASSIGERIQMLVNMADAAVTLPGSIGTLAEFLVAWNTAFVAGFSAARPIPLITVGQEWRMLADTLADRFGADTSYITFADTVEEAAEAIRLAIPGAGGPSG